MKNITAGALLALFCLQELVAQPSLRKMESAIKAIKAGARLRPELTLSEKLPNLGSIRFDASQTLSPDQAIGWLKAQAGFRLGKDDLIAVPRQLVTVKGIRIEQWQQYYQQIKVEHGRANITSVDGRVSAIQLELYNIPVALTPVPSVTEATALSKAVAYVGVTHYAWEGQSTRGNAIEIPRGDLVWIEDIFKKPGTVCLAYKFLITSDQPLTKSFVYVNAHDGSIVFSDAVIKHASNAARKTRKEITGDSRYIRIPAINASGSGQTRYSGAQPLVTGQRESGFHLRAQRNGDSIITLNYQRRVKNTANNDLAVDFSDLDNNWAASEFDNENYDNAALDAHFGLEKVSDYWNLVHGRKGWDNLHGKMISYVHVREMAESGYDNAYWDGISMNYGDGTYLTGNPNGYLPLTSLDVTAHEIGHGICQSTARLTYQRESGALNEGFSDIWGACIEHYSGLGAPKQNFLIGEELVPGGGFFRSMSNPNLRNSPDTYDGAFWHKTTVEGCPVWYRDPDYCGIHSNSGVLNKWFFLITQGETGVNDFGNRYAVYGLGFAKSEQIAYLTELLLTPNADYTQAREASISAANASFGACSNEAQQVINAWYAVGVGSTAACTPSVEFASGLATVDENGETINSCTSKVFNIPVRLAVAASADVRLNFNVAGTALNNTDYSLPLDTLLFRAGESGIKYLPLTVLDDATADGLKSLVLSFSVNNTGGNASAGPNNQTFTLNIIDNDLPPARIVGAPLSSSTLINEQFETTPANLPAGWTEGIFSGAQSVNRFVVGNNGGAGISGQAAYISNDSIHKPLAYTDSSATQRFLRMKAISTVNLSNIKLSFKCKVNGEFYAGLPLGPNLFDYGGIVYSVNGDDFLPLLNPQTSTPYAFYNHGDNAFVVGPLTMPAALNNQPVVYLGFLWNNDAAVANNPPLLIDDVMVTGQTLGAAVETKANEPGMGRIVGGIDHSHIYSTLDSQLIARISDASEDVNCLTAVIKAQGNGKIGLNGIQSYNASQKIYELDAGPGNGENTIYTVSLYYTSDELASWGAAKTQLKMLKVKSGVSLSSNLTAPDVQVVTPTSVVDSSATTGTIIYTGSFKGFSQYLLVDPLFALPVTLKKLWAAVMGRDIRLTWQTESETNNKGFEMLRSYDGVQFEKIAFIHGRGNTAIGSSYEYIDRDVRANVEVYYRLRQVDLDGRSMLSEIVSAKTGGKSRGLFSLSPNPVSSRLSLLFSRQVSGGRVSVVTPEGKVVKEVVISPPLSDLSLDADRLEPGIYLVRYADGITSETRKFVKK